MHPLVIMILTIILVQIFYLSTPGKIPLSRPLTIGRVDKKKKIPIIVFKTPRLGQSSRSAGYWTRVKSGFPKLKSMLFALR